MSAVQRISDAAQAGTLFSSLERESTHLDLSADINPERAAQRFRFGSKMEIISDFPVSDKWIRCEHLDNISFCQFGIQNLRDGALAQNINNFQVLF